MRVWWLIGDHILIIGPLSYSAPGENNLLSESKVEKFFFPLLKELDMG
jgi:hypothetical protein